MEEEEGGGEEEEEEEEGQRGNGGEDECVLNITLTLFCRITDILCIDAYGRFLVSRTSSSLLFIQGHSDKMRISEY